MIAYIESPLQLICSIEFQQKNQLINTFYIRRSTKETDKQIDYIITKYSFLKLNFIFLPPLIFKNIFSWSNFILFNFYKSILIGNYDAGISRFFLNKTLSDDGTKTISILNRGINKKCWTFFNIDNKKKHSFDFTKYYFNVDKLNQDDIIYFIGQKLVETNLIDNKKYLQLLKKVKSNYKDSKLYYFVHRGESKENLTEIKKMGFIVRSLDYPVEFHPIEEKLKPKYVIGFLSTALIILNEIYNLDFSYFIIDELLKKSNTENNYVEIYRYLGIEGNEIKL